MINAKEEIVARGSGGSGKALPGVTGWNNPLAQLTLARIREFVREPEAMFWTFGFPILLACALGIAFRNTAPEKLQIAVESGAVTSGSGNSGGAALASKIAAAISASQGLEATVLSPDDAANKLRTGKVAMIVRPAQTGGQESGTAPGSSASAAPGLNYQYDPTRPDSRIARLTVDDALQRMLGRADIAKTSDSTETQPGARYIDFLIPGLIGLNLMGSGMWGLGFAVVNARTRKLLKRFAATPMRRSHYLFSFMLSRLVFLVLEVAIMMIFGWAVFNVTVHGSIGSLALISLIGSLSFAGLGMLVAARPRTIEGVSGMMNLVMLPMWLLSGTFFSYSRFPQILQPVIKALPLTALNDSLRAVVNDGSSLSANIGPIVVMAVWGLVSFALALKLFRWQ